MSNKAMDNKATSNNLLISADKICVKRNGKSILDHISLDIFEHDFITVIGPNGAGKSVLLSCLMDMTKITSGQITRQKNLTVGYVPQAFHAEMSLPMTAERFLLLGKKPASFDRIDNFSAHYDSIIARTNIGDILKKSVNILSGGEMQRVLVARALMNQPQLLVLDEPAQNLDVAGQLAFYKLIDDVYKVSNISVLMVSHELHLVMASTQRVICLYKHICCSGEPQMVMKDPEFISLFGNDMSKMMAVYQHQHSHTHHHE